MKIGLYAKVISTPKQLKLIEEIIQFLLLEKVDVKLHQQLSESLNKRFQLPEFDLLCKRDPIIDYLICIGGDGTILDAVQITGDSQVPIIGVNTGRLGFLANVSTDGFKNAFSELKQGSFNIDKRSLLQLESNTDLFRFNYALNDFVLHKKETSSMITVHAFLNGEPLNSYWADGLIIATPTGSSGYSLSCGGPILFPKTSSLVITPIAPHNLNVRPIIIPDDQVLSFEIEGRSNQFLASLDSRSVTIDQTVQIAIRKADFSINLLRFEGDTFLKTLRNKMLWGMDNRN
ncbi:MAG: NAD kinase [Bacteroidetes bacterium]|nr:NAD kinase [Bacteroidota bacterium]